MDGAAISTRALIPLANPEHEPMMTYVHSHLALHSAGRWSSVLQRRQQHTCGPPALHSSLPVLQGRPPGNHKYSGYGHTNLCVEQCLCHVKRSRQCSCESTLCVRKTARRCRKPAPPPAIRWEAGLYSLVGLTRSFRYSYVRKCVV